MIYVEDQLVKVNGVVLPGLVKSIEVKESAQIDEQEVEGSAAKPKPSLNREPVKKVSLSNDEKGKDNSDGSSGDGNGTKQVIIQKLLIPVDLKKIKDLQQLLELLKEVEDFANANGSEATADDPDAVPATT